jgi:acyl-homoserine-lactone acylase
MARKGKWVVLIVLAVIAGIWSMDRQTDRQLALTRLASSKPPAPYKIVRDPWGIPSIYGATDAATAYGMAIAHAEDDFPTIQARLAPVRGLAGAIYGREGAVSDVFGRLLGVSRTVDATIGELTPEARAIAKAYADGINAYAGRHPGEILHPDLFPVTERDVIGGFVLVSPLFYGLDNVITDLMDGNVPEEEPLVEGRGSNAFAIAPSKMADGSTVLISNSHQPWEGPAAWWEARMASGEGWSMAGSTFPGVPFILMGYNEHLSWTNTVNVPDLVDVYRLRTDDTGDRYSLDGEWRDIEKESFWLKVKFGPFTIPVRQTVERSIHGPVIRNDKGVFAFRYAGMERSALFEQYYALNRAKSFSDWEEAMRMQAIPSTNFLYADKEGNIAYLYNAAFPRRSAATDWSGVLPGDRSDLIWQGYEAFEVQPYYVNPPSGYLINANNTPFLATAVEDHLDPEDFADLVGVEDKTTNRILRSLDLMAAAPEKLTHEDLHRIKYDTAYDEASPLGSLMAAFLADDALASVDPEAFALLQEWDWDLDGEGASDSIAALVIYNLYLGMRGYHPMPEHEDALAQAAEHLRENFGRLDPPLGEMSRLRRGEVDLPLIGGPDALRALYWGFDEDGRLYGLNGDSYIAYVRWDRNGKLDARTIYPFGSAMARRHSPHYADQSDLFATERMKPAPLPDWREAAALAEDGEAVSPPL